MDFKGSASNGIKGQRLLSSLRGRMGACLPLHGRTDDVAVKHGQRHGLASRLEDRVEQSVPAAGAFEVRVAQAGVGVDMHGAVALA